MAAEPAKTLFAREETLASAAPERGWLAEAGRRNVWPAPVLIDGQGGSAQATDGAAADGGDEAAALATKLSNPVASMISVPIQYNYDRGYALDHDGYRSAINIQPVIPFSISRDWVVISRTIVPLIEQKATPSLLNPTGEDKTGVGDVTQSLFLSPKEPLGGWLIWGAGPVVLLPTASDEALGGEKWAAGPTVVALTQQKGWTAGVLANHLWSFADKGSDERTREQETSLTFVQPFVSYLFKKTYTTIGVNTEATYNWEAEESDQAWSVPINLSVSQMLKIGGRPISISAGPRYWAESPDGAADGWGFRCGITFLF
jgi:hypothetical protein